MKVKDKNDTTRATERIHKKNVLLFKSKTKKLVNEIITLASFEKSDKFKKNIN